MKKLGILGYFLFLTCLVAKCQWGVGNCGLQDNIIVNQMLFDKTGTKLYTAGNSIYEINLGNGVTGGCNQLQVLNNSNLLSVAIDSSNKIYTTIPYQGYYGGTYYYVAKNGTELGVPHSIYTGSTIYSLFIDKSQNLYYCSNSVFKWNGTNWIDIGGSDGVHSISNLYNDKQGNIYAIGNLINSNGKFFINKYDGNNWSELGGNSSSTFNAQVSCLAFDNSNNIYAAGNFTNSQGKRYVAKFDGTSWSELGGINTSTFNNAINSLTIDNGGRLYAIGSFRNSNNYQYVAKYNGTSWVEYFTKQNISSSPKILFDTYNNLYVANCDTLYVNTYNSTAVNYKYIGRFTNQCNTSSVSNISIYQNQLPYHWNGLIFDSSGSKTAYLLNSKGCDSIATLNLNIISPIPNYLPTNGLVGWWPFNGNANDESGNGNNGTVNGATLTTDRNGNSGKAYSFDGVDDYIKTSNISFANNVDYTISLWVNLSVAYSSGYPQHYLISNAVLSNGAYLNTDYDENQFGCNSTFSTNTIGNWHHYLAVKSGNNYTLLIDNITIGTQSNCNTNFRNGFPLFFGNSSINTEFTNGKIDDIAIYNRALTQQEVTALYTGTNCTPTTSTTNISICPTALPYIWNGLTFNTAGSQTAHLTNAAGCDSAATLNLSFNAQPTPAANNVCVGGTIQLTNATSGGVWASVNNRATVNATGLVTGANAGGAVITYKKNGVTTNYNITVNAIPNVPSIVYAAGAINPQLGASRGAFCINKTFGIVGIPAGGVFTTGNNAIVTINCSGTVNTVGLGNSSINYRYTNAQGCSNSRTMTGMVVNCAARGVNTVEGQPSTVNDFTIYPNPAKLIVNLNIDCLVGAGSIVVTDLYGKIVKTQALSLGTNTIDIATLSKGMYFVSTITNEGKTTKKLVVE